MELHDTKNPSIEQAVGNANSPLRDFCKLVGAAFTCGIVVALTAAALAVLLTRAGEDETPNMVQTLAVRSQAGPSL